MANFNNPDRTRAAVAKAAAEIHLTLARYLGIPAGPGLVLLETIYTRRPWVPVPYVARRACVSEDTARRRLDELVAAGRALSMAHPDGRGKVYRLDAAWADRITAYLLELSEAWRAEANLRDDREREENIFG